MTSGTTATPIGAHVQIKGGLATGGLAYTDAVGARAVQVFVGNPRGWKLTAGDPEQDAAFTAGCACTFSWTRASAAPSSCFRT